MNFGSLVFHALRWIKIAENRQSSSPCVLWKVDMSATMSVRVVLVDHVAMHQVLAFLLGQEQTLRGWSGQRKKKDDCYNSAAES